MSALLLMSVFVQAADDNDAHWPPDDAATCGVDVVVKLLMLTDTLDCRCEGE